MNLSGLLANKVVVAVLAFVVSTGAALGVSSALTGGSTEGVLPETAQSVPVIAPVETGPIPSADDPAAAPDDGTGGGSGGGGSGGSGGGGSDATVELSPVVAESTDFAGASGASGGDGTLPIDPSATRFVDDCAGTEPGATPPAGCPDPSTGGTILPLSGDAPPPFTVQFVRVPSLIGETNRCSVRVDGRRDEPWAVVATNPGTMKLEYWPLPAGGLGTLPDPSTVTTIQGSTEDPDDSEHRLWAEWFSDGSVGSTVTKHVQYCEVLRDLIPGKVYSYRVTSTDIFGATASETGRFTADDERRRPPVTVTATDSTGTAFAVGVPVRSSERERSFVTAVPASGDDARTCAEEESATLGRLAGLTTSEIPESEREADGYPYKPAYDETETTGLRLAEGRTYTLCIWWQRGPARSFDAASITERESRTITSANRYRVRVTLEGIEFYRPVDREQVQIRVTSSTRACLARYPLDDRHASSYGYSDTFCDLTSDDDSLGVGDWLDVEITGPFGQSLTSRLDISARPGADVANSYYLNIPAERAVSRLCGTGIGSGCVRYPVELPRDESVGAAYLRVDLIDGPGAGGVLPNIGPEGRFAGPDGPAPEPPPYAQVDTVTSRVEPIPGRTDALRVVANLDRPATVRASLNPSLSSVPPCLLPGASGTATSGPAETHDFVLEGLCANWPYYVTLELTDVAGNVSYAIQTEDALPEGTMLWYGWAHTPAIELNLSARLTVLATPDSRNWVEGRVQFGDGNAFLANPTVGRCVGLRDVIAPPPTNRTFHQVSNEVLVTVEVDAGTGCRRSPSRGSTSIRATVSVAELRSGTVTLTSPDGNPLQVQLELSAINRF